MDTIEMIVKGLFKGCECELKKRTVLNTNSTTYSISMKNKGKMELTKQQAEKACKLLNFKKMYVK